MNRVTPVLMARRLWMLCALLMLAALLAVGAIRTAGAQQSDTAIQASAAQQIRALITEKESRTPAQRKIDSQLLYAMKISRGDQIAAAVPTLQSGITPSADNKVIVDITCIPGWLS